MGLSLRRSFLRSRDPPERERVLTKVPCRVVSCRVVSCRVVVCCVVRRCRLARPPVYLPACLPVGIFELYSLHVCSLSSLYIKIHFHYIYI